MDCNQETQQMFSYLAPLLGDLQGNGLDLSKIDWDYIAKWYAVEEPLITKELGRLASLDI